ncbi:MAG: tetratricopeptide repeat protein [Burkholderiales bacterium]|nr:tetratricopeptide repeat protein [Burkholderiales bacterium]
MSLLLDALKRAEQAKQSAQPGQKSESASVQSSGAEAAAAPLTAGSTLSLEAIAEPPRPAQARAMESTDRDAVRNVFAAKQSPAPSASGGKPVWLLPVIAVVVVAVGGGGWFVWNEINKLSPSTRITAAPVPKSVTSATPSPPPSVNPAQVEAKPAVDAPIAAEAPSAEQKLASIPLPERVAGARSAMSPAERAREELARSLRANNTASDAPVTLKLARGIDPPKVSEALAEAYGALRAGKNTEARKQYESLVRADGLNLDARLGLATALARSGETPAALREYKKALEIDPRNSTALAALLILTDASSAPSLETDLRALLTRHGESAELHYALGNLLASQSRWTEAQQSYFDAWRLGSENADYAFNLAVSLDQLRQTRLAADYYQKALALGARQGGQFDRRQAERRLNELKSVQASQ